MSMSIMLTIINLVVLLVIVIAGIRIMILVNAFEELLARFVEVNGNYYKSQQHMLSKLSDLNSDQKKLSSTANILKRVAVRLNTKSGG